jgi:integrase
MSYPKVKIIRHRKQEVRVYKKSAAYGYHRISYHIGAKRVIKSFKTYSLALEAAEKIVRDLAESHPSLALSRKEATEALAIRDVLEAHTRKTGKQLSALVAVSEYTQAVEKLEGHSLIEAVDSFMRTSATVKHIALSDAVKQFTDAREPLTVAPPNKRPQLNLVYFKDTTRFLTQFADKFPGHQTTDITKEHINLYCSSFPKLSVRSRNARRSTLKMFLRWCVAQDFLSSSHRLFEAVGFKVEPDDTADVQCYTAHELRLMLENSNGAMRVTIALVGLGGLRLQEALRLVWEDFTDGHVQITSSKSKTRQRRLVEIGPSLEQWLHPFRHLTGKVSGWETLSGYMQAFTALREDLKIQSKRNGLRHAFCSAHLAMHNNENLTAALAGNSPTILHSNYKGLMTKAQGEAWFAVRPASKKNVVPLRRAK